MCARFRARLRQATCADVSLTMHILGVNYELVLGSALFLKVLLPDAGLEPHFFVGLFGAAQVSQRLGKHEVVVHGLRRDLESLMHMVRSFRKFRVLYFD